MREDAKVKNYLIRKREFEEKEATKREEKEERKRARQQDKEEERERKEKGKRKAEGDVEGEDERITREQVEPGVKRKGADNDEEDAMEKITFQWLRRHKNKSRE